MPLIKSSVIRWCAHFNFADEQWSLREAYSLEFKQPGFDGSRIHNNLWSATCLTLPEPPNPISWLLLHSADQNPTQPFLSSGQSSLSFFPRAFQISPFGMGSAPSGVSWPCFCTFQTTERSVLGSPETFCVPHLHASRMAEFPSSSKPSPLVQHCDLHSSVEETIARSGE